VKDAASDATRDAHAAACVAGNDARSSANAPQRAGAARWNPVPISRQMHRSQDVSPLREGETIEVHRMAPEDACSAEMLVLVRWHGRVMAVPLSQLTAIDSGETTRRGHWRLALLG
jgi:hypothetical protein